MNVIKKLINVLMMPFAKMKLEATHVNVQAVLVMESAKGLKNSIIKLLC